MSQRGRERDAHKERVWRDAIRRWQASVQTIRGFCRDQGLSEAAFHAWRRTIAQRDKPVPSIAPGERGPVFVPLRVAATVATTNSKVFRLRTVTIPPRRKALPEWSIPAGHGVISTVRDSV